VTVTIAQAWDALDAALDAAMTGVQVTQQPTGNINPPALVTMPADGEFFNYKTAFSGAPTLLMVVTALVGRGQDKAARTALADFAADTGARSVFAAVAADPTLGGVVASAEVLAAGNYGSFSFGGPEYLGCVFTVEIYL
jgi:hypothetical protein